jgi:hypothetical protein
VCLLSPLQWGGRPCFRHDLRGDKRASRRDWRGRAEGPFSVTTTGPHRGTGVTVLRGFTVVGARGFEPPTFRSRIWARSIAGGANRRQVCARWRASGRGRGAGPGRGEGAACAQHRRRGADLKVLWVGRDRLLRVAEVAEHLGICAATVYRLCERWELPHVRIVNSSDVGVPQLTGSCSSSHDSPPTTVLRPQAPRMYQRRRSTGLPWVAPA